MTRYFFHAFCFSALLVSALWVTAWSPMHADLSQARLQLSRADYARSEGVRPNHLRGKLKNGFVVPHWIGQEDDFWYRRDTAAGHEFIIVEAASGHAHPAF